jgi:short-subunit dehydrogenase
MNLLSSEVYKRFGDLDLLINCAGVGGSGGSFEAFTIEDDWKKVIDINMWSIIYSIYAFLPGMMKRGAGHIVNVASVGGVIGEPYNLPYVASKFAVVGLSEALYTELRKKNGIRVSVICPSPIKTPIMNKMKFRFSDELMSSFGLASFGQKEHDAFQGELKEWYNRHGLTSDEAARRYIRGIKRETLYIFDGRIYQLIISLKGISSHLYEWFLRYLGNMYTKMLKDIISAIQERKSL